MPETLKDPSQERNSKKKCKTKNKCLCDMTKIALVFLQKHYHSKVLASIEISDHK